MRNHAIVIGLTLGLLCVATVSASDIYKWVDEQGNVHYTDRPEGEDPERLDIESRPTDLARVQAVTAAIATERNKSAEAKAAAAAEQPTAEERRQETEERAIKCAAYQEQLVSYTNNRRLYKQTADGEREYLSDDEITQTRELAAQRVSEFCN